LIDFTHDLNFLGVMGIWKSSTDSDGITHHTNYREGTSEGGKGNRTSYDRDADGTGHSLHYTDQNDKFHSDLPD
jgi:hypothetical protein